MNVQIDTKLAFAVGAWGVKCQVHSWTYCTEFISLSINKNYFALQLVNCKLQSVK